MTTNNAVNTTSKRIIQVVSSIVTTNVFFGTVVPVFDGSVIYSNDYLPQSTDGSPVMSCSITPMFASSNLYVEYFGNTNEPVDQSNFACAFLLRDAGTSALATTANIMGFNSNQLLVFMDTAGSTATTTYTVNLGPTVGGHYPGINGFPYTPVFGGTMCCRLLIYEIGA